MRQVVEFPDSILAKNFFFLQWRKEEEEEKGGQEITGGRNFGKKNIKKGEDKGGTKKQEAEIIGRGEPN